MVRHGTFWAAAALLIGCAPVIPKELWNARVAYRQLSESAAAVVAPREVQHAHNALAQAENAYAQEGASANTRALAAEAEREADEARSACAARGARGEAEGGEKPNVSAINTIIVKERTVVTLPSEVLFAFDEATLMPSATKRLLAAVEALRKAKGDHTDLNVVVVGHTDSVGDPEYNKQLSERRAEAVRDFLVAHGQNPNFVTVQAMGSEEPVTSNDTPEGRANNRRVEILIRTTKHASLPRRGS